MQATETLVRGQRTVRLILPLGPSGLGAVSIATERGSWRYWMRLAPSELGEAYRLTREDSGETYLVELTPQGDTCNCPHARYRGQPCKHALALRALKVAGKLEE